MKFKCFLYQLRQIQINKYTNLAAVNIAVAPRGHPPDRELVERQSSRGVLSSCQAST